MRIDLHVLGSKKIIFFEFANVVSNEMFSDASSTPLRLFLNHFKASEKSEVHVLFSAIVLECALRDFWKVACAVGLASIQA